ncbi:hypothetical protein C7377_0577 [Balneicella halophila]|uniref:N-acetyltransferase domain-containing protein n=1 Tax=Balneicella halophila TaxID=1537566 RepID=A0A7L4UR67_BALHA|nr:hypothetical protein [Balneicella halophila]PVX52268.1 hypothetical protein C7377_0577 [Balneicella halophila]
MSRYNLVPVTNEEESKEFIQLTKTLYKGVKNYVQPIDDDIAHVFDPAKNEFFKHGECTRWILQDAQGKTVGRVAAFIDRNILDVYGQPTGGMGFFECINDQDAAFRLFDACKEWLQVRNIEAMDGPVNFGPRLQWWGLHTEGDQRPVYGMFYHHSYYKTFFEDYGFQVFFKQFNYRTELCEKSLNRIVLLKAKRVYRDKKFHTEFFDKKNIDKYIQDFTTVYNNTWVGEIPGVEEMTVEEVRETFEAMKPLLEERYVIFAYYDNKPVGFFVMVPDANEIIKHVNGKFNLKAKLYFLWYKYFQRDKTVIGQIFGVDRAFQGRGVEAILIEKFSQVIFTGKEKYKYLEFNWIGDFNPRMQHMMEEHLNAKIYKTYITYRYLFDRTKEFKRAEILK